MTIESRSFQYHIEATAPFGWMDGWVLGIVEDTIDKVDRNDISSSNALRTGKVIPNSIESMKSFDFPKKHSIGTFRLLTTIAPIASFRHNLPLNKQ